MLVFAAANSHLNDQVEQFNIYIIVLLQRSTFHCAETIENELITFFANSSLRLELNEARIMDSNASVCLRWNMDNAAIWCCVVNNNDVNNFSVRSNHLICPIQF